MLNFRPTFLYIKQHNVTGLKYFGKTIESDPIKYKGSGKHWLRHLKKYGNDVTTIWYQLFIDKDQLTNFALSFSQKNNIVESREWANLKPEDGLCGGGVKGIKLGPMSEEHKQKIRDSVKKKLLESGWQPAPKKEKIKKNRKWSQENKTKLSEQRMGRIPWNKGKSIGNYIEKRKKCLHCGGEYAPYTFLRWHDEKCKNAAFRNHGSES